MVMTAQHQAYGDAAELRDALTSSSSSTHEFAAAVGASLPALQRILSAHAAAQREAAAVSGSISEQDQDLRRAAQQQATCLDGLFEQLQDSITAMRATLDSCHKLLDNRPTTVDPHMVVAYAHRLRHHFFPLGATPGLPFEPPAPQPAFMLASSLNQFNLAQQKALEAARAEEFAEQQAEARRTALMLSLMPPDWSPGDPIPDTVLAALAAAEAGGQQQQQQQKQQQPGTAAAAPGTAAAAGPAAAPPRGVAAGAGGGAAAAAPALIDFGLNADLMGDEVDEEFSSEFSDD